MILPLHVGLITDGNRRWAKEHGLPSLEGHRQGFLAVKKVIEAAYGLGIKNFTAWAFSTENWDRSKEEIDYLMKLYEKWLSDLLKDNRDKNIKIRIIGQKWRVPKFLQEKIAKAEEKTASNSDMVFNMALSYGGRDEIVQAIKKIQEQGIATDNITEQTISDNIWTPDVDLIIRTGGEMRLSGYLMWQAQYAELIFVKKYLPDFAPADFEACLTEFANRQRRFGK
jgi:undecaprenyl diphosphate synthase